MYRQQKKYYKVDMCHCVWESALHPSRAVPVVMFREEGEGQATAAGTRGRGKGHVTVGMMVSAGWGGTVRSSTTCARAATIILTTAIILTTFSKKKFHVTLLR